jgi:hypothetical protein
MNLSPVFEPSWKSLRAVLIGAAVLLQAAGASAGIHTWDVREVFSNFDGTIQYVELIDRGTTGAEVGVGNGSLSSAAHSFSWSNGPVDPGVDGTDGKSYLIATAGFAALPGAPVPDVIIPAANVPFFDVDGDTISFAGVDTLTFGLGEVPTNGTDSLSEPLGVGAAVAGPNTPKNYAGVEGSVDAGGAPAVPSWSVPMILITVWLLVTAGFLGLRRNGVALG